MSLQAPSAVPPQAVLELELPAHLIKSTLKGSTSANGGLHHPNSYKVVHFSLCLILATVASTQGWGAHLIARVNAGEMVPPPKNDSYILTYWNYEQYATLLWCSRSGSSGGLF